MSVSLAKSPAAVASLETEPTKFCDLTANELCAALRAIRHFAPCASYYLCAVRFDGRKYYTLASLPREIGDEVILAVLAA